MTLWLPSVQLQLRSLIHMELAKCEEDVEQLTAAIEHVKKVGIDIDGRAVDFSSKVRCLYAFLRL